MIVSPNDIFHRDADAILGCACDYGWYFSGYFPYYL